MNAAGSNSGKLASKYRSKGVRLVAVDANGVNKAGSEQKWKAAGADFYLYDNNMNCFEKFYKSVPGVPYNMAIKAWQSTAIDTDESSINWGFGF